MKINAVAENYLCDKCLLLRLGHTAVTVVILTSVALS